MAMVSDSQEWQGKMRRTAEQHLKRSEEMEDAMEAEVSALISIGASLLLLQSTLVDLVAEQQEWHAYAAYHKQG